MVRDAFRHFPSSRTTNYVSVNYTLSGPLSTGVLYIFATANSPQCVKQRKIPKQIELFNTLDFIKTTACDAENSLGCDSSSEHMFSVSPVWEGKANELELHLINVFIGKLLRKMTNFFMRMQKIILQLIFLNRVHVRLQKFLLIVCVETI